jgi:hypothetical protein
MALQESRSRIEPHWHVFDETRAWLAHCASVEARIARTRLMITLEERPRAGLDWASRGKG